MLADTLDPITSGSLLLMVGGSQDGANRIEGALRRAAFGVRTVWVADLEELEDALRRGGADLVLAAGGAGLPLVRVLDLCKRLAPELPVLELGAATDLAASGAAIRAGARDRVCASSEAELQHLAQVYRRESLHLKRERELLLARARLNAFECRHRELLDELGDAVIQVEDGLIARANKSACTLLRRPWSALIGSVLLDLVAPDQQPRVKEQLRQLARAKAAATALDTTLLNGDGRVVPVKAQLAQGSIESRVFVELRIAVETSPATTAAVHAVADAAAESSGHAPDRLALFRVLAQPAEDARPRAVLLFVVDGFASLESRVGLQDAERVMKQVAEAVAMRLGGSQKLFRFSTDEWVALASRASSAEFEKLAERLCQELGAQVFACGTHETRISLTVVAYPIGSGEAAVQAVDPLIREGRRVSAEGGARALVIGPTAQAHGEARETARRAAQLKRALDEDRMRIAYQSIASLEGEPRPHFDVLVRMVDENGEEHHASEFVGAAAQFGLMRNVDRWVITQSLKILAKRDRLQEPPVLLAKLSEDSLRDTDGFLAWLQSLLAQRPLAGGELCFSVQELAAQNHLRKTQALAQAVTAMGAGLAIEHFGIGTHSAQLLEQLPARLIKFHGSYTKDFAKLEVQRKMGDLLSIARRRGMRTIACQVEDANVMARMWQLGVHYIQGYHVQEPEAVMLAAEPVRG